MRPRSVITVAVAAVAATSLGACASTQEKSAKLKSEAKKVVNAKGLDLTGTNKDVKVLDTTVLHDQYGTAAVVYLENLKPTSIGAVPVAIDVRNAAGKSIFRNNGSGLDTSLVSAPLLEGRKKTVWVNNQITGVGAKKVLVKVGTPKAPTVPAPPPKITLSKIKTDHDSDGIFVTGVIVNHSKILQKRLVITCVAHKGGKIVAAGRGIIDKVPPAPTKKPVRFSIYFIGNPTGAKLGFSAPPVDFR